MAAIAQLDYHPSEAARRVRSRATYILGVAIPDAKNPHYLDIMNGLEQEAQAHEYNTSLILTNFAAIDDVALQPFAGERQVIDSRGHRRIRHIFGVADQATFGGRLDSLLSLQHELGLPWDDRWLQRCGPTPEDGYNATRALIAACAPADLPTALVVDNDSQCCPR